MSARGDGVLRGRAVLTDGVEMPISYGAYKGRGVDHFVMDGDRFERVREREMRRGDGPFRAANRPVYICGCGAFCTDYTDATSYHKPRFCPSCGAKVRGGGS